MFICNVFSPYVRKLGDHKPAETSGADRNDSIACIGMKFMKEEW